MFLMAVPVLALFVLCFVVGLILQHAEAAGVNPSRAATRAFVGWAAGVTAFPFAALLLVHSGLPSVSASADGTLAVLCSSSLVGAVAGAAAGYLHLRMTTVRDPDYGPPDGENDG